MGALWTIYLIFVFFALSHSTLISRKYTAKLKSNGTLLGEYISTSVIECAVRCQRECSFFGFNPQMKKCRAHKKIFTSEMSDEDGWRYYSHHFTPKDCKDLRDNGHSNSGVYEIYPFGIRSRAVRVYCDMETMNGGWTTIQKRVNGSLSFNRDWMSYKNGFGDPGQDIWIGNDVIHHLAKENTSALYVSITLQNGTTLYEMYDRFTVSDESENYQLFLAGPATGTLGDGMMDTGSSDKDLSGMFFTTPDRDHDKWSGGNCAVYYGVGWWYYHCFRANLNVRWSSTYWWYPTVVGGQSVRETTMLIKRH